MPPPEGRPWFLPQELAAAYEFPDNQGAGQTIGIIELAGHYIPSDLEEFSALAGIGAPPDVIVKNVETLSRQDRNDPSAIGEVMLDVEVVAGHAGPAYGVPHSATVEAIRLGAALEGLVLDPVYSGKGLAGLMALVRAGRWTEGEDVVFIHTGGAPALFAYRHLFD